MEKIIGINSLKINPDNPRNEPQETEEEEINILINTIGDKILELAKHIVVKGLDPAKLIRVYPSKDEKGIYIVADGNRRVTALKCLKNPNLVKDVKLKQKFQELAASIDVETILIKCFIFDNEDIMNEWIEIDHTGENEGVGQVKWDAIQTDRFKGYVSNKTSLGLQLLNWINESKHISQSTKDLLSKVHISTLNRLISDPSVRKIFGLSVDNDKLVIEIEDGEISKGMEWLIEEITKKEFSVKDVYHKHDRQSFVNKIPEDKKPDNTKVVTKGFFAEKKDDVNTTQASIESTGTISRKTPVTATKSIIFGKTLRLKPGRVNNLYSAIKDIYERSSNANRQHVLPIIGMSLRLLLDLAARDYYISINSDKKDEEQPYSYFLADARKDMQDALSKSKVNYLALTTGWLNRTDTFEGRLGKYAHYNTTYSENDVINDSKIVGEILEFYFK